MTMHLVPNKAFWLLLLWFPNAVWSSGWQTLAPGLTLGRFSPTLGYFSGSADFTLLRIHPKYWDLTLLAVSHQDQSKPISTREWAKQHKLVAVINAGMYQKDYRTHVGYMKLDQHINSRALNHYQSYVAFAPYTPQTHAFRIYDSDSPDWNLSTLQKNYRFVLQNLRLIKRPALNRWKPQAKRWSEAALGEDRQGRILFLFCSDPLSMYDFNRLLLALPIDLVSAQHLEGGPKAQIYIRYQDTEIQLGGSYETGLPFTQTSQNNWPLPNVLGVKAKQAIATPPKPSDIPK